QARDIQGGPVRGGAVGDQHALAGANDQRGGGGEVSNQGQEIGNRVAVGGVEGEGVGAAAAVDGQAVGGIDRHTAAGGAQGPLDLLAVGAAAQDDVVIACGAVDDVLEDGDAYTLHGVAIGPDAVEVGAADAVEVGC